MAVFYPCRLPCFVFLFVGLVSLPSFLWPRGIALRPSDRQDTKNTGFPGSLTDGYAMLMSASKGETAVHGCHCPNDMAVRMREVMARPWVCVCVWTCVPLALIYWN